MIVAPGTFSEEQFDPKAWVNATCEARPADESVDKYLSEVEMKLQLLAGRLHSVSWIVFINEISISWLLLLPLQFFFCKYFGFRNLFFERETQNIISVKCK